MTEPDTNDSDNGKNHNFRVILITVGALCIAIGFNLVFLFPEVTAGMAPFNDSVFHLLLAEMAADAITHGRDVTDPWQSTIGMGFPVFHYYQHLSHIVLGLAHVMVLKVFPLIDMMRWSTYFLLSVFPISIYWSVRHFGFGRLTAAMGALVASLAATQLEVRGFGLDYGSYLVRGWGLYAQLWGMVLLPPTLAVGYRVLQEGRGYFCATLLLSATLMSHLMYGYMAFLTLGVLTAIHVVGLSNFGKSFAILLILWRRLLILLLLVVSVTSYFLAPFFLDQQYIDPMTNMHPTVKDALGLTNVISGLMQGDLFDFQRFPSLTVLVFAGLGICLIRWREKRYLIPVSIFLLGLMLYFGKATWGSLWDILPLSESLHVYRFIGLVHLGGFFLAAIALATPWNWAISQSKQWAFALATALTLLLLIPVHMERQSYLSENSQVIQQTREALKQEELELNNLLDRLNQLPPGRAYAGEARDDRYNIGYTNLSSFLYQKGISMAGYPLHEYSLSHTFIPDFSTGTFEQYDLFNTKYIVSPTENEVPDFAVALGQFGRHHLFEVETSGYFDLVESDLTFAGEREHFYPAVSSWMDSKLPTEARHPIVLLDGSSRKDQDVFPLSLAPKVIPKLEISSLPAGGTVVSEKVFGHTYEANVVVDRESTLLLKASYHPNFRATVNGETVRTMMLMPGFVGVELPPGDHNVHIEYQPRTLRKFLLCFGLLTLILVLLAEKRTSLLKAWFGTAVIPKVSNHGKSGKGRNSGITRRRNN